MRQKLSVLLILIVIVGFSGCVFSNKEKSIGNENNKNLLSDKTINNGKNILEDNNNNLISSSGKDLTSFVPKQWKVLKSVQGDLNKDGLDDIAAVIEKEGNSSESAQRILFIALQKPDKLYYLSIQSDKAILKADEGGVWGDPFSDLSIENGSLLITFYGGSNWRWEKIYRFRYQDNGWYMIGATIKSNFTGTYEATEDDYNLLTGDMIKIETSGEGTKKTQKINRGIKNLVNLKDFIANNEKEQF